MNAQHARPEKGPLHAAYRFQEYLASRSVQIVTTADSVVTPDTEVVPVQVQWPHLFRSRHHHLPLAHLHCSPMTPLLCLQRIMLRVYLLIQPLLPPLAILLSRPVVLSMRSLWYSPQGGLFLYLLNPRLKPQLGQFLGPLATYSLPPPMNHLLVLAG